MKIVSLLFLLFVSLTLGAQDITGKWYGYPDLKNMRLRLEYHVEKAGGVQASADSERAFFLSFGRGDFSECG